MNIYLPIAGIPLDVSILLGLGLSVGILSGMFGVGGGFILTPLLIILGVPPLVAVGTGASQVVATAVSGAIAHWQRGNVDLQMGLALLAGGLGGTSLGVQLQRYLKSIGQLDLFTSLTYAAVLTVVGTVMLMEGIAALRKASLDVSASASKRPERRRGWVQMLPFKRRFHRSKIYVSVLLPIGIGFFVGILTAIMGAGGGFILIPLMIFALGMPTRVVLGTSSFQVIFVTAFTTVIQSVVNNNVDLVLGFPLMLGGVIGAQFGVRIGERLRAEQLRVLLALLVLGVGFRMLIDLVIQPRERFTLSMLMQQHGQERDAAPRLPG
jgi:uncharacterized membrane protein YfcA